MPRSHTILTLAAGTALGLTLAYVGGRALAAPGTLDPPAGPIEGIGVTTQQLSDQIASLRSAVFDDRARVRDRKIEYFNLTDGQVTQLGSSGQAILRAVGLTRGRIRLSDPSMGTFAAIFANPIEVPGQSNTQHLGSNEAHFDVIVELPLTITNISGDQSVSELYVIYTPLP